MQRLEGIKCVVGLRVTSVCLMAILVLGALPGVTFAQVDTHSNLHDAEEVSGVEATAPSPYVNSQDISLLALGETDPLLYSDVSFYAYGLFCDVVDVNLANSGAIDVNAVGGNTTALGSVEADVYAYGIDAIGDVNNIGDILVSVLGGTTNVPGSVADVWTDADAYVEAYGIGADGDVDNTGGITVMVTGGTATSVSDANDTYAYADADTDINAYGIDADGDVDNAGAIAVTAAGGRATASIDANNGDADGYVDAEADADVDAEGINAHGDVNNTGAVILTVTGGTATATAFGDANDTDVDADADADADACGIDATGAVTNTGAFSVTVTGGTASVEGAIASGLDTSSDVDAYAEAEAVGIDANAAVTNTGALTVTATGSTAIAATSGDVDAYSDSYAWTSGIYAGGGVNNTGAIVATATAGIATADANDASAEAYATAYALGIEADGALTNSAAVEVAATGGRATASADANEASASASALAAGLYSGVVVANTGDVTVTATGGVALADTIQADAYAYGIYSRGDVNNTGDVTVVGTAEAGSTAYAYGIYLDGDGALTNTGTVRVSGDEAYEVYVATGTTTLVDRYNVTLDGDPNVASFYVADGATLALNDATLGVAGFVGETLWDTEYKLFEVDPNGAVDGNFVDAEAINPYTTVTYHDQNSVDSSDDTVSLNYTPSASSAASSATVAQELVVQSIDTVHQHMTGTLLQGVLSMGTSGLVADAGPTARSVALAQSDSSTSSGVFFEPYYSKLKHDANPMGYDADLWGFAAGYECQIDNTLLALHAGYGQADLDYTGAGYSANSEDQDIVTAGVSGLTLWDDWTLRYGLAGFYGSHDYDGLTGVGLTETEEGDTDSYGLMASLMAGRVFRRGSHVLLPEVGVNYSWGHRQGYTTEASNPSWDTTYSAMNEHDVQAEASLNWLCGFMHDDVHVMPSASIGIRHLLTDGESSVTQSVPGTAPVSVDAERDRTAMTVSGAVVMRKTRHTLALAYDGEYSPDAERHSLWLRYGWQF